jgi:uncharacterized membrane protein YbhN (UPF0104 family)
MPDTTPPRSPARTRTTLLKWIGTLGSSALFVWLVAGQDWQRILLKIQAIPGWILLIVLLFFGSGLVFNAWRWYVLLRAQQIPMSFDTSLKLVVAGSFASNFLPSTIGGDVIRIAGVMRLTSSWAIGIGSIVLDRVINVLAMGTTFPAAFLVLGSSAAHAPPALAQSGLLLWWRQRLPGWLTNTLAAQWEQLYAAWQVWSRQPLVLAGAFLIAWLSVLVIFIGEWILAQTLGIPVGLHHVMGVSAIAYFATLLPISINGYGVREVLFTTLYMQLGGTLEQAAALALISRFLLIIYTLPGALWLPGMLARERPPAP